MIDSLASFSETGDDAYFSRTVPNRRADNKGTAIYRHQDISNIFENTLLSAIPKYDSPQYWHRAELESTLIVHLHDTEAAVPRFLKELARGFDADTAEEFNDLDSEAVEKGYEPCGELAKNNAWKVLRAMYAVFPSYCAVSPTSERSVRIAKRTKIGSLVVLCKDNGGATCIVPGVSMFKRENIEDTRAFAAFIAHVRQELKTIKPHAK